MKYVFSFQFILLFSFSLFGQFTISGTILDQQNAPLPGAHVSLLHPWGEVYKTNVSGTDGRFELANVENGG